MLLFLVTAGSKAGLLPCHRKVKGNARRATPFNWDISALDHKRAVHTGGRMSEPVSPIGRRFNIGMTIAVRIRPRPTSQRDLGARARW
jgi:hypothetical protein